MGERLHGRVVADDPGQRQMLLRHVRERDIRSRLGGAEHKAGVLHRKEPLGDQHITGDGHAQGHGENPQHQPLVRQGPLQALFIQGQQTLAKARFGIRLVYRCAHKQRGQGRRQGQ